jgi:anti-sigma factor RsiW
LLTCKEFLQELNDYLDETVGPEVRKKLEQHVAECPNCWVIFDTTKKTIRVYKGTEPQPIPQGVHDRLMLAIQRRCAARHRQDG